MSSISSFGLIFAACATSAFAMGMDKFDLSSMIGNRNLLIALGILILAIAGYMLINCPCCSSGKCSGPSGKKMKKHLDRAVSVDSKRNSSSSSVRRSPRKSKQN